MARPLSPETREATFAALPGADIELLVVGGGITGAGIARDAALRGIRTALIERWDFAAGTSSRSSKLIHGGVRYLQQGDIALVREAAHERAVLRHIAPHLCTPLLMVMPTYSRGMHLKLRAGLWAFEKIAGGAAAERHVMWERAQALDEEPLLRPDRLHGAATFTEFLTDDARLVLDTVKGAHAAGAMCLNHTEVLAIESGPRSAEITVRDVLAGSNRRVRARVVVNAAGPWVEEVCVRASARPARRLQLTKGIHIVLPHERLPIRHIVVMYARDKRAVFAIPRDGIVYIGTTDTSFTGVTPYPDVTGEDVDYLLDATNRTFAGAAVTRADLCGAWAGLRPLLHEEGKSPSEISRKDEIMVDATSGLISIAGGKLTTYRRMAERVVDLVAQRLGRAETPCTTAVVRLPGGEAPRAAVAPRGAPALHLPPGGTDRLARLYGADVIRLLDRVSADAQMGIPMPGLPQILRAEVAHVLDEEMALTLVDVLERRTRALLFDPHQGLDGVEGVADMAAARLGWSAERRASEIDDYRRLAASLRSFP